VPNNSEPEVPSLEVIQAELAEALAEIGRQHMPFGKYGPQNFPPYGVPLYDLPVEYLIWFKQKGFPTGKLGKLLELVCQIKVDGSESVFQPFRKAAGGRHPLKVKRAKNIVIDP
jgi:uncharacterized protein (DUF3820 family)